MSILGKSIILNTNSMINHFEESVIPYGTLERFGLTQENIEDLLLMSFRTSTTVVSHSYYLLLLLLRMARQKPPEQDSASNALLKVESMYSSIQSSMSMT